MLSTHYDDELVPICTLGPDNDEKRGELEEEISFQYQRNTHESEVTPDDWTMLARSVARLGVLEFECAHYRSAMGRFDEAVQLYTRWQRPFAALMNQIRSLECRFALGEFQEVKSALDSLGDHMNADARTRYGVWFHTLRGRCFTRLGENQRALAEFDNARTVTGRRLPAKQAMAIDALETLTRIRLAPGRS